ncbi:MAG: fasciclin domain-containing protein [Flavobacteriales bacterium]|nr:fasciclin domain-containing protein [Flavobacteriales bacterium]
MKTNKLFLMLLTCFFTSYLSATIHTVNSGGYYFTPSILTINLGDTVEWINDGGNHDVNADINSQTGSSFNNPVSFQSNTTNVVGSIIYTHIFNVPGNYSYDCSVGSHAAAGMVGTISVNVPSNSIYDIVSNSSDHTTLKVAIDACALDGVLSDPGSLTLFAPTDAAFNLLPAGTVTALLADLPTLTDILKHHVVGASVMSTMLSNNQVVTTLLGTDVTVTINSMGVFIDNAQVIVADLVADNGVVHVIDAVLLPPTTSNSIYDIVSNSADHATLKVAIDACALDGVLSDPGSLTLFAPTDAAFNLLPAGTVTALLNDIPQLTDILKHHVVGASVMSTMLSNNQVVTTLLGTDVTVTINSMGVFIDNAMVTVADIVADNGVVHVIDAVLLPSTTDIIDFNGLEKSYLYSINILGKKVSNNLKNQIIFNVFEDGSVVKIFNKK